MRLLLIIMLLPIFSIGQFDTTKFYRSPNVGDIFRRAKINALMLPSDTTTNKVGIAQIGSVLYSFGSGKWNAIVGADTTILASKDFTNATYALRNRAIVAGYGLAGGGDLSADRSFSIDTSLINQYNIRTFGNQTAWGTKILKEKLYLGGADTLFENDRYVTEKNTLKIGGVTHQYGIARDGTNGGMDYTFFKENGDVNGNRTPIIANRRVLPGQEIAYHQYSAHNGVDSIYSARSVAAIIKAQPSYNSRLGDLHGWLSFITAQDSGFKTTPPSIDFVLSEGKAAFNAPINLRNSDLIRTMTVYGSARASDTLLSSVFNIGTNLNLYKNGSDLCYRNTGSSFDVLKFRESTRPVAVQGGPTHLPFYIYTDAGGGGFTNSLSVSTGLYLNNSGGFFNINNNESFRYDFGAGGRVGVNTGSGINANLDVRGNAAISRIFQAKNSSSVELFSVNENGRVVINPTTGNTIIGSTTDNALGKLQVTGNCYVSGTLRIGTITISTGTGSPEGVVTANVGSQFMRTDGGANTTLYVKESGTGNTGWVAK